jgi:hypothetical protein
MIKVKPCFSDPERGGKELNPRKERSSGVSSTPPLLSNKRVKQLFSCPIF